MEDKKTVKVSLGAVISIFIIFLLIIALGVVYYFGFIKNKKEIDNIKNQKTLLETINTNLEAKISDLELKTTSEQKDEEKAQNNTVKKYKIKYNKRYVSPKFYYGNSTKSDYENIENWEDEGYIFKEDGTVSYYAYEAGFVGKYTFSDDGTIKINIDHFSSEPGGIYNEPIDYKTELKIIDENTLIGSTMERGFDDNARSFEYNSPYKIVYTLVNN